MTPPYQGSKEDFDALEKQLQERSAHLLERERELADSAEELSSQKEELNAAIEELMKKNVFLVDTLNQLRDRNHELDQILYRTSHDLRSPLSSIKGIITLLKLEPQSDIIRNYSEHIDNKASQMDSLLRSLASLSKAILEEPVLSVVDLNKMLWQVINEYRHLPSWDDVEVNVQLQESKVVSDASLMMIIFQSLISNAFIFRVPLKKGVLTVRTIQKEQELIIEVMDDGEGIADGVQAFIFDMFYRGSERSRGSGLGLYVAKRAAGRLKGTIGVSFIPGKTCFTVTLPLNNQSIGGRGEFSLSSSPFV